MGVVSDTGIPKSSVLSQNQVPLVNSEGERESNRKYDWTNQNLHKPTIEARENDGQQVSL